MSFSHFSIIISRLSLPSLAQFIRLLLHSSSSMYLPSHFIMYCFFSTSLAICLHSSLLSFLSSHSLAFIILLANSMTSSQSSMASISFLHSMTFFLIISSRLGFSISSPFWHFSLSFMSSFSHMAPHIFLNSMQSLSSFMASCLQARICTPSISRSTLSSSSSSSPSSISHIFCILSSFSSLMHISLAFIICTSSSSPRSFSSSSLHPCSPSSSASWRTSSSSLRLWCPCNLPSSSSWLRSSCSFHLPSRATSYPTFRGISFRILRQAHPLYRPSCIASTFRPYRTSQMYLPFSCTSPLSS